MTPPDLAEVIAEALSGTSDLDKDDYRAQARAVLAALEAAGQVEWGALTRGRKVPYRYVKEIDARNSAKANHGATVSRVVLPWREVDK